GGWRAERRMFRISPERPEAFTSGDPEAPGLTHQSRVRPRLSTRHRGIRAIGLLRVLDRPASVVRLTRLSQEPPGDMAVSSTPAGTASRPANMTPHECALSGRDDGNINSRENESRIIFTYCDIHLM